MDQRKDPRVPGAVPVRLTFAGTERFLEAFTENVSLGGVFVQSDSVVPQGTRLDLTIELSAGKGIRAVGEVAWCRPASADAPAGLGVRFVEMAPAYRQWLEGAVQAFLAKAAGAAPALAAPARTAAPMPVAATPAAPAAAAARSATAVPQASVQYVAAGAQVSARAEYLDLEFDGGGLIVGIDLGTSNSAACIVRDGKPVIIDLGDPDVPGTAGNRTLPSVVAYDDQDRVIVGSRAVQDLGRNPKRTVFGAKRFIGRTYESPAVQSMLSHFPYRIMPDSQGKVGIEINGKAVALTAVSAQILRNIREKCSRALNQNVERAIITVPAYYNDNQRAAVVHAGTLAGLSVERILNEPTAAAVAYGVSEGDSRRILVYDLGGGTFDVSIMKVQAGSLQVLATAGDTFLGGEDFDAALVQHVCQKFQERSGKRLSQNHAALAVIKDAAEKAKKRLSTNDKSMVTVREVLLLDGAKARLEVEVSRVEFEQLVAALVERTFALCTLALEEAGLAIGDLAEVLLVGGMTRMPLVRSRVRDYFQREPRCELNPDEVVAMGAGLLPHLAQQRKMQFADVLPMAIGLAEGHKFRPLIARNTPVPCRMAFPLSIAQERYASTSIELWQGDSDELHQNEKLGSLRVNAVAPGDQDPVPLVLVLSLSEDCLLKVELHNSATHQAQEVLLESADVG